MAEVTVEFDSDLETTKAKLAQLLGQFGELTWVGNRGTFAGTSAAKGAKGQASITENGAGTAVTFSYSLPLKLRMLAGAIDNQIRKALTSAGGRVN